MPKVSVTMTAYNAEKYITDALQSVLMQSFDNFEFIIVDDGSSDATWQILNDCSDNRLIILRNEHDYIASLNCAMHMARGEYIVRMDADDMMHPDRLSMQVSLMEQNPELDVCTTWMEGFDLRGMHYVAPSAKGKLEYPLLHLLHKNNLYHPTAIIRSSFWKKHHLHYDSDYIYALNLGRRFLSSPSVCTTTESVLSKYHVLKLQHKQRCRITYSRKLWNISPNSPLRDSL